VPIPAAIGLKEVDLSPENPSILHVLEKTPLLAYRAVMKGLPTPPTLEVYPFLDHE